MFGFTITVRAPVEADDGLHHALIEVTGGAVEGCCCTFDA